MAETDERACPKCGGAVVETKFVSFMNTGVLVPRDSGPLFSWRWSRLRPVTCLACGYTEFYAAKPSQLASRRR